MTLKYFNQALITSRGIVDLIISTLGNYFMNMRIYLFPV